MKFALDDDQRQLQSVLRGFLDEHSASEQVRKVIDTPRGYDADLWRRLGSELDVLGINLPEEHGGSGSSFVELAVVARELGRAVAPVPFLASVVLAGQALVRSGDAGAQADWLPKIATGELVATLADPALSDGLTATGGGAADAASWTLSGTAKHVLHGGEAELLLALADTDDGPTLFAVTGDALSGTGGVHRESHTPFDLTRRLADLSFTDTPARPVGSLGAGAATVAEALDRAAIALAAEQVGGAERCLDTAVEYAKTRQQFNRPIGSFQAIKHLLADLLVEVESASAAADYAAWVVNGEPGEVPHAAALAKSFASDTYLLAAKTNIQVHGGIGFTWEHDAHLHFRRATSGKQLLGSPEQHRERLAVHLIDNR